jgi:hypothetical protein
MEKSKGLVEDLFDSGVKWIADGFRGACKDMFAKPKPLCEEFPILGRIRGKFISLFK